MALLAPAILEDKVPQACLTVAKLEVLQLGLAMSRDGACQFRNSYV